MGLGGWCVLVKLTLMEEYIGLTLLLSVMSSCESSVESSLSRVWFQDLPDGATERAAKLQ